MSESTATEESKEGGKVSTERVFKLNEEVADKAYETMVERAEGYVTSAHTFKNRRAGFLASFVNYIYTIAPADVLNQYRRLLADGAAPSEIHLNEDVAEYLKEKGLKAPSFDTPNPFLSLFQQVVLKIQLDKKYITQNQYDLELANGASGTLEGIESVESSEAARNMQLSRDARQVLAAIDIGLHDEKLSDTDVLNWPYAKVLREYPKWQRSNPTIALRLVSARGSGNGGTGGGNRSRSKSDTTDTKAAASEADKAAERAAQDAASILMARDPFAKKKAAPEPAEEVIDGEAEQTEQPTEQQTEQATEQQTEQAEKVVVPDTDAERKLDEDLTAKTRQAREAARSEPEPETQPEAAAKPAEVAKATPDAEAETAEATGAEVLRMRPREPEPVQTQEPLAEEGDEWGSYHEFGTPIQLPQNDALRGLPERGLFAFRREAEGSIVLVGWQAEARFEEHTS